MATSAASASRTPRSAHSDEAIWAFAARLALRSCPKSATSHESDGSTAYDCTIFVAGVYSPSAVTPSPTCGRYCARTLLRFSRASSTREAATATSRLLSSARATRLLSTVSPNSVHHSGPKRVVSSENPRP